MNNINGILVSSLPFELSIFVGTLLYQEFPSTVIYTNSEGVIIVKEWVDCNDKVDRFFIYKVSPEDLHKFIKEEISHFELFHMAENGVGFLVDDNNINLTNVKVIAPNRLPIDYLPSYDSFFKVEDGVDTNKIVSYFNLESIRPEIKDLDGSLMILAKERKIEIFNLHYKRGEGVGFGRISTHMFSKTILSFDELYKEMSLDYFYGKARGEERASQKTKIDSVSTEIFLNKAASFSAYIKPIYSSQMDLFENKTHTEKIAESLFELFGNSSNQELLNINYSKYSDFVFKAYKIFLKDISVLEVDLELKWVNNTNRRPLKQGLNSVSAKNIIDYIININTLDVQELKMKGKFSAINCNTAHFTFESIKEGRITGYFDKLIRDMLPFLNFKNLYEVNMEKRVIKEAGIPEHKNENTILSYHKITEENELNE